MLEIRLLGRYQVKLDGQPVEIASRPAQTLLAYLALTLSQATAARTAGRIVLAGFERTAHRPRIKLPAQPTRFVGRAQELAELIPLMAENLLRGQTWNLRLAAVKFTHPQRETGVRSGSPGPVCRSSSSRDRAPRR